MALIACSGGGGGNGTPTDTTAPTLSETAVITTTTTLTITTTVDETGTLYWEVLTDGAAEPTTAQIKAGTDASDRDTNNPESDVVEKASQMVTTVGEQMISITSGLTADTAYDIYLVADDAAGNSSTPPTKVDARTSIPGAPGLVNVAFSTLTERTAVITFDLTDDDSAMVTVHWVALDAAAMTDPPSKEEVIAGGTEFERKGSSMYAPGSGITFTVGTPGTSGPALDGATAYVVYLVAADDTSKDSGIHNTDAIPALPTIPATATAEIAENSQTDTPVIDLGDQVTGENSATYTVDPATLPGELTISDGVISTTDITINYDTDPLTLSYPLTITVTDATNDRGSVTSNIALTITVQNQVADLDGDGLIEISSRDQLNAIRYDLDGNGMASSGDENAYMEQFPEGSDGCPVAVSCTGYELAADIDLGGSTTPWTPIGDCGTNGKCLEADSNDDSAFSATLEGNDKTIRNLYIRGVVETPDRLDALGLFGLLNKATIRNLKIAEVDIVTTYRGGTIERGDENSAGALAALVVANSQIVAVTVTDSDSAVDLQGANTYDGQYIGGLVGYLFATGGVIRGSSAAVTVSGGMDNNDSVGGLVGYQNSGSIIASYASGTVTDQAGDRDNVGGLVGSIVGGRIIASYASGAVSDQAGDTDKVGGLAGGQIGSAIIASYARGAVTDNGGTVNRVGGLVGLFESGSIIAASYATGAAQSTMESANRVGPLVGLDDTGTGLTDSYGFGAATGMIPNSDGPPPVTAATGLSSSNVGATWKPTVWIFGDTLTPPQPPALLYVDGHDRGTDNMSGTTDDSYTCDSASFLPIVVVCGTTPLPGQ